MVPKRTNEEKLLSTHDYRVPPTTLLRMFLYKAHSFLYGTSGHCSVPLDHFSDIVGDIMGKTKLKTESCPSVTEAVIINSDSKLIIVSQVDKILTILDFITLIHAILCDSLCSVLDRVVNVSRIISLIALKKCNPDLQQKFIIETITEEELVGLMNKFMEDTKKGVHRKKGWPNSAHGVTKIVSRSSPESMPGN